MDDLSLQFGKLSPAQPERPVAGPSSLPSPSPELSFRPYKDEDDLPEIMELIERELSEPYVIYTYRYFLREWPQLSFMCYAHLSDDPNASATSPESLSAPAPSQLPSRPLAVGTIVCKQDLHRGQSNRGYIAMLTTRPGYRKRGIAKRLVQMAMDRMILDGADEIVLETEVDNQAALGFYESLGFIREKRLHCFYLNRKDAMRLVRVIPKPSAPSSGPPLPAPAKHV